MGAWLTEQKLSFHRCRGPCSVLSVVVPDWTVELDMHQELIVSVWTVVWTFVWTLLHISLISNKMQRAVIWKTLNVRSRQPTRIWSCSSVTLSFQLNVWCKSQMSLGCISISIIFWCVSILWLSYRTAMCRLHHQSPDVRVGLLRTCDNNNCHRRSERWGSFHVCVHGRKNHDTLHFSRTKGLKMLLVFPETVLSECCSKTVELSTGVCPYPSRCRRVAEYPFIRYHRTSLGAL